MNLCISRTSLIKLLIKSAIIITLIVLTFCIVRSVKAANINDNTIHSFKCTSLRIEENDTLWDIACKYYTEDYSNIDEYIRIIKDTNNMNSDVLHIGNYIIVPYYQ